MNIDDVSFLIFSVKFLKILFSPLMSVSLNVKIILLGKTLDRRDMDSAEEPERSLWMTEMATSQTQTLWITKPKLTSRLRNLLCQITLLTTSKVSQFASKGISSSLVCQSVCVS